MLSSLIASLVTGEAVEAVGRARKAAIVYALAGLCLLCGFVFLLIAGFVLAAREYGTIPAALGMGCGFLVIAILLVAIHQISATVRAKRAKKRRQSEMTAVASAAAVALLPTLLASSKGRSLALVGPALAALGWAVWRENSRRGSNWRDSDGQL